MMVGITETSAIVTAVGVLVGVVYYLLEIRHQNRIRETDLEIRMNPIFNITATETQQAVLTVFGLEYTNYEDFVQKYGTILDNSPTTMSINTLGNYFEAVGYLLKRRLVDINYVWDCYGETGIQLWEKLKPIVEGSRKQFNMPRMWWPFEYFYNEMKKREQKLQSAAKYA
jgi:hypothetical protein